MAWRMLHDRYSLPHCLQKALVIMPIRKSVNYWFILLFRSLTRYHSVITPILSNTFPVVWQGEDKAVKPSCDSETVWQHISKTYIYVCAYNIFKNNCLTVTLSHKKVAKRTLNDRQPPLIHRLSTRWGYKGSATWSFENKKTAKLSLAVF